MWSLAACALKGSFNEGSDNIHCKESIKVIIERRVLTCLQPFLMQDEILNDLSVVIG